MTERLHFTSLPSTYLLSSYLGDVKHLIFIVVNRIGILGVLLSSDPSIPSKLGPKLSVIKTQFNWKLTEAYNSPLEALLHAFIWGGGRSMWGCELWCRLSVGPCVFLAASCSFPSYSHKAQWLRRGLTQCSLALIKTPLQCFRKYPIITHFMLLPSAEGLLWLPQVSSQISPP